jgi:mannose-6-phosphate isomerase-like protein (cupin superfamily)
MDDLHIVDLTQMPWQPHPTIAGVLTKIFENRASHHHADVLLVKIAAGGAIPWHVHENASETAYVLSGNAKLICARNANQFDTAVESKFAEGIATTIPVGMWHSVQNSGDEPLLAFAFHTPATF